MFGDFVQPDSGAAAGNMVALPLCAVRIQPAASFAPASPPKALATFTFLSSIGIALADLAASNYNDISRAGLVSRLVAPCTCTYYDHRATVCANVIAILAAKALWRMRRTYDVMRMTCDDIIVWLLKA